MLSLPVAVVLRRVLDDHVDDEHAESEEAQAEGKTADELANEATKRYLALRGLQKLQGYGQRRAEELGITEEDIPRLIAESRAQRRR